MAISRNDAPVPGTPRTWKRPATHSRSCGATSSIAAATSRARSRTFRAATTVAAPETGVERDP
jgi:hypothetical protein